MYIAAEFQEIIVRIDHYSFESSLVEVPDAVVAAVVAGGVAYIKMPHEFGKVALRSLHDHMKVIAHEHISMDPNLVNPNRGPQLIEKSRPIPVISKNISPLIAAAGGRDKRLLDNLSSVVAP
jgi:hypothetical protein